MKLQPGRTMQDSAPQTPCFVTLPDRGLVRIGGPDRRAFLQGLVTNDIALLDSQPVLYACLLTAQGKFLHDFFVSEQGDVITLECEGGARAENLCDTLKKFRLRANITLEPVLYTGIYIRMTPPPAAGDVPDPRHPSLGFRCREKPDLPEAPFALWDRHRIALGVPDGSRDMTVGQSTMEEGHFDWLNAISYDKGCYIGQELTARMHYRGLGKKHIYTVQSPALPPPGTDLHDAHGGIVGTMRSSCSDLGLALLFDPQPGTVIAGGHIQILGHSSARA